MGFIFSFSVPKSYTQEYLLTKDYNVVATLATCGFFYQSTSFFRKIDWSNFQNDVIPNILLETYGRQINTLLRVCACVEMNFLGQLADFILIIFIYLSTVSYQTGTFLEAERSISSSVYKSILLNCVIIWPI